MASGSMVEHHKPTKHQMHTVATAHTIKPTISSVASLERASNPSLGLDVLPPEQREVKEREGSSKEGFLEGIEWRKYVKSSVEFSSSLRNITQRDSSREMISLYLTLNPIPYLELSTRLMFDTNGYENIYYQPDYYYNMTYASYQPDSWGFSYYNYENNQFQTGEYVSHFEDGTWEVNYRNRLLESDMLFKAKYIPASGYASLDYSAQFEWLNSRFMFEYEHVLNFKQNKLSLSARKEWESGWFVSGTLFGYTNPENQAYIDPDYSFEIGWKKENITVAYSNAYMHTRWGDDGVPLSEGKVFIKIDF